MFVVVVRSVEAFHRLIIGFCFSRKEHFQHEFWSPWFQHEYAGMSLGFTRDHKSSEAHVRCLWCRLDLKIERCGISTCLEHCRGVFHHKLDCLVRFRSGLFLRRRTGAIMSAREAAVMEEELRGLSVPDVEERCARLSLLEKVLQ